MAWFDRYDMLWAAEDFGAPHSGQWIEDDGVAPSDSDDNGLPQVIHVFMLRYPIRKRKN